MELSFQKLYFLGIPTYGRSFTVQKTNSMQPPILSDFGGKSGPLTKTEGYLGYQEICLNIQQNGWTKVIKHNSVRKEKHFQFLFLHDILKSFVGNMCAVFRNSTTIVILI